VMNIFLVVFGVMYLLATPLRAVQDAETYNRPVCSFLGIFTVITRIIIGVGVLYYGM
jgi:heme/copper-type cytochrome/quinol oxidase subunit 2